MITPEGWQPCRFIEFHDWSKHSSPRPKEQKDKIAKTILLARPYIPTHFEIEHHFKRVGCDAERFYLVDTEPLEDITGGRYMIVCEHEILSD